MDIENAHKYRKAQHNLTSNIKYLLIAKVNYTENVNTVELYEKIFL